LKIALVTTPWSSRSGIADYTRHLLPYLRGGAEVQLFVEVGRELEECAGEELKSVEDLDPRAFDQILYQLGNEAQHAFMVPMVKLLGGTVVLHDWVLFDLAMAAYPALQTGGLAGLRRAYSEGGVAQALRWRRSRKAPQAGIIGWFTPESGGRWSAARGPLPVPAGAKLELRMHVPEGRRWSLLQGQNCLAKGEQSGEQEIQVQLEGRAVPELQVENAGPSGSDARPLGVFLQSLQWSLESPAQDFNLDDLPSVGELGVAKARFDLPLNHSIVRHGDAFLVHSDVVGKRILESRNAVTPIYRVHHGVEPRWHTGERVKARELLGLGSDWEGCFLLATFGAMQAHKRPAVLLDALASIRKAGHDVRLLCIGEERPAEFDAQAALRERGLEEAVHITGWLSEQQAWEALHASDLAVNLRGPSTGGTSGGASQALSMGRPVVVSDLPEMEHFPESCVLRVPNGGDEVEQLSKLIVGLCQDPQAMKELEVAARAVVTEELHWRLVAERYLELLQTYPRARASRRSLLIRFVHATAKKNTYE
jgi:glycosyltransferase involved in cell wall biosynthesis